MTDSEAHRFAERFWALVGRREHFPRTLELLVLSRIETFVVLRMSPLRLFDVRAYCQRTEISCEFRGRDRALRAFLLARAGWGFVFLDGTDTVDEQRFSFAHELAHFLLDHLWPREEAIEKLGLSITKVLDGERPPTDSERINSILKRVTIDTLVHLNERSESGAIARATTLEAEDRADRLAIELLAPQRDVISQLKQRRIDCRCQSAFQSASSLLRREFGLPCSVSDRYGTLIVRRMRGRQSFAEWLE